MKLFKKLAAIHSESCRENKMRGFISAWIKRNVPAASVTEDVSGNMYIKRGDSDTYPCVVAHLDQVQDEYPEDIKIQETSDIIFSWSPSLKSQCGLGADDKCGIWIALKMLKKHPAIKIAFFSGEESGCVGSCRADMDFFADVRFVIEPDRRGFSDIITSIGGLDICSLEFLEAMPYEKYGFKETRGAMTDVETLVSQGIGVACINVSCGYYEPHTSDEYVIKEDMLNTLAFIDEVIETCTDRYDLVPFEEDICGTGEDLAYVESGLDYRTFFDGRVGYDDWWVNDSFEDRRQERKNQLASAGEELYAMNDEDTGDGHQNMGDVWEGEYTALSVDDWKEIQLEYIRENGTLDGHEKELGEAYRIVGVIKAFDSVPSPRYMYERYHEALPTLTVNDWTNLLKYAVSSAIPGMKGEWRRRI